MWQALNEYTWGANPRCLPVGETVSNLLMIMEFRTVTRALMEESRKL